MMRIASVDIGTNTLLMTIAEFTDGGSFTVLHDAHTIVRLGENLASTGRIGEPAIERARACMSDYDRLCAEHHVDLRVGVATSAVRTAQNGSEVLNAMRGTFRGSIQCISGLEEAELTFIGSVPDNGSHAVLDIGGGSTEIVLGANGIATDRSSFEIGAVVLHEQLLPAFPSTEESIARACSYIAEAISMRAIPSRASWLGVAGTPTTLALVSQDVEYTDVGRAQGYVLEYDHVCELTSVLLGATRDDLFALKGIHPRRADILPSGALILREVMKLHECSRITVSTQGLRYGVLKRAFHAVSRR